MHVDVADLRDFYKSGLGQMVRRIVGHRIRARWRPTPGGVVIGLGFASPYLGAFCGEAARVGAFMPEAQGALIWPSVGPARTVLVEEERLPLPDNSVDRVLVVHCLEVAARSEAMLREIWRVLGPEGRLLIVVPNRRGVWARLDTTPFGVGRPYSRSQLERLLTGAMFTPIDCDGALYVPPFNRRLLMRSAVAMERVGSRISPAFAGLLMMEARKETSAPVGKPVRAKALRDLVTAPSGGRLVLNK
jgi:SAM-dependent methyltransferase